VTLLMEPAALELIAAGFHGKLPARGDFVQAGLPRSFTDPWDGWIAPMLASSRASLGESWLAAWLEAPVWRFALTAGICGPDAALGLWLPSVDSAGRYFPLTLAAVTHEPDPLRLVRDGGGFLAAAEMAGRVALANDLPPEALARAIAAAAAAGPADPGIDLFAYPDARGLWWTEGGPRVAPGVFVGPALPDAARFAAMLDASLALLS
jgi:type VI secretion system protein ImpM